MKIRRSARLVILDSQQRILLFNYADEHQAPFWATPGGELRSDETYRAAARRELFEETGLAKRIEEMLRKRDAVYAVAQSTPARWLEKYYLVSCSSDDQVYAAAWSEEECETIQSWRWWSRDEMLQEAKGYLKPAWLPELVDALVTRKNFLLDKVG